MTQLVSVGYKFEPMDFYAPDWRDEVPWWTTDDERVRLEIDHLTDHAAEDE